MKQILFLLTMVITFSSCNTYKTFSAGKDNMSYIVVLGENETYKNVEVKIDGTTTIIEKVFKKNKMLKSLMIKTEPGEHTIEVTYNGEVLLSQRIYIGLQETKKIILP